MTIFICNRPNTLAIFPVWCGFMCNKINGLFYFIAEFIYFIAALVLRAIK